MAPDGERAVNRAIFLDRDGVLNELVHYPDFGEDESPRTADDLRVLPGVRRALLDLRSAGWLLFIVSNQPSYAKGKTTLEDLKAVHAALMSVLMGVDLRRVYYSYTHPAGVVQEYATESAYRKPNVGFLLEAQRDFDIDLRQSWMVGDRDTDIWCGQRVQLQTALIRYPLSVGKQGESQPDMVCDDLPDFVSKLQGV